MCIDEPNLIDLIDKMKITKFKVKYNLLDDLDYFPFPKKWTEEEIIGYDPEKRAIEIAEMNKKKKLM